MKRTTLLRYLQMPSGNMPVNRKTVDNISLSQDTGHYAGGHGHNTNRRWSAMSEYFDPRVRYSAEPWNNPLKQSTGFTGMPVDHRWRKKLIALYTCILNEVKMIPETNIYRQSVENMCREFLRIVSNVGDTDWMIVERKIGLGQVEQLIEFAMDERELVQAYAEWKLWLIPVDTVREIVEESRALQLYSSVGPPEPYLSDEEIADMKKIDQQRMAEEQKLVQAELQQLEGRTTRMMVDTEMSRKTDTLKRREAVEEYIREAKLGHSFVISSDGAVKGAYQPDNLKQVPRVPEDEADDRTDIRLVNKYDNSPELQNKAVKDWKQSEYVHRGSNDQSGLGDEAVSADLPSRVLRWEASQQDGTTVTPQAIDSPHAAPAAKASKQGRKIAKWIRTDVNLAPSQEQPAPRE